ncbi:MAG: OmpA family protein [Candidatus Gastranaerophilales bacterium]|nr:OmpA family protein [Candidatus Gastranaerophilales bacterium]
MAKKKHAEEHENLERWLVSYADFMTLLFATFVVLYALAQTDVNSFKNIEEALRRAFSQNIFENQANIMDGSDSILEGQAGATNPLMLEYMSQKYEKTSYEEIKENVEKLKEEGVSAEIDDRGLVIRLDDHALQYAPGTADLTAKSLETLNKVAQIIKEKFSIHYIQVEGHTDPDPISNSKYPSNWELSSARASSVIRHMIAKHGFNPKIFIATGLADTIPVVANTTPANKSKNRRVEIIILKNKNKHLSKKNMQEILKEAKLFQKKSALGSSQVEELIGNDRELLKNVIDMTNTYESETKRLNSLDDFDYMHDGQKPDFIMEK